MLKKYGFRITVILLVMILMISVFYVFAVHIPYSAHQNELNEIRNEICEANDYVYDGYFNKHNGMDVYYIMKVKVDDTSKYVCYNDELEYVASLEEPVADEANVLEDINEKYECHLESLDIGYENNKFVYTQKILGDSQLTYVYYSLETGEFVKAYFIEG